MYKIIYYLLFEHIKCILVKITLTCTVQSLWSYSNLSHLSGPFFVDDTDLLHINMEEDETVEEAHEALQSSVDSWGWGNLLIG